MKKLRLTLINIFMMSLLPLFAQTGMQPGWKIGAEIETASTQDFEMKDNGGTGIGNGSVNKNMKATIDVFKTFSLNRKLTLGFSGGYHYYHLNFYFDDTSTMDMGSNHHLFKFGGNVIYNTKLWDKPLLMMGNLSMEGSQWGIERMLGMGTAMLMLKTSREDMLGVGLIGMLNSTFIIPVFPMIIYRKVFSPQWVLNVNYPFIGMQYLYDKKQTLTAGFSIDNEHFWLKPALANLPEVTLYTRLVLNSGIKYEYKLSKQATFTGQAGWANVFRTRMFRRKGNHELMDFGSSNGLYAKIGIIYRM